MNRSSLLTEKQERFCAFYVESGNATEAYRRAYEPPNATDKSIHERASRLLANSKVVASCEELRAPVRERAGLTLEQHIRTLAEIRDKALAAEQYGAAVQAETNRGKAAGLYVERTLDVTPELTGDQRAARALELFAAARARVTSGGVS